MTTSSGVVFDPLNASTITPSSPNYLWEPYLVKGSVTALCGGWKVGKSTLLHHLLAASGPSGGTLLGTKVPPMNTLVVTEEGTDTWAERLLTAPLPPSTQIVMNPYQGGRTPEAWADLLHSIAFDTRVNRPLDLLVLDPISEFLPVDDENSSSETIKYLSPLCILAKTINCAVLFLHHMRKSALTNDEGAAYFTAARGSGALMQKPEIIIQMHRMSSKTLTDPRRRLERGGRLGRSSSLTLSLSDDHRTYSVLSTQYTDPRKKTIETIVAIIKASPSYQGGTVQRWSIDEIIKAWPQHEPAPAQRTVRNAVSDTTLCDDHGLKVDKTPSRKASGGGIRLWCPLPQAAGSVLQTINSTPPSAPSISAGVP